MIDVTLKNLTPGLTDPQGRLVKYPFKSKLLKQKKITQSVKLINELSFTFDACFM